MRKVLTSAMRSPVTTYTLCSASTTPPNSRGILGAEQHCCALETERESRSMFSRCSSLWTCSSSGPASMVIAITLPMANMMAKMRDTATRFNTRPTFTITESAAYDHTKFPQRPAPNGHILIALSDRETCKKYRSQQHPISKLIQLLIVRPVANHPSASEFPLTINIVNPSLSSSALARDVTGWGFWFFRLPVAHSTEVGSRTPVHAGASGMETHGKYLNDCMIEEPSPLVTDAAGKEGQERIVTEILKEIKVIQPGASKSLRVV